uniref:DSBA-like thioredoxin domain-containing protein n=1 Tax=Hemiselmis andersenii TaxID=464988 RepID=A0A6T8NX31_HEMAN|mmetsp:Transcript_28365/g.66302  ORF Transcript_28365/g.66302 Transcript_28365/m.66302 type:complete len:240 (+) Transcript_28365:289-1008(+)
MQINVTRHPYSFIGDTDTSKGYHGGLRAGTWHTGLMDYTDGTESGALAAEAGLQHVAKEAGIRFDFGVRTDWQPTNSQRMLLWAGRFGKQEEFMSALNKKHFEQRVSASDDDTLLSAAEEVGLDTGAAREFLRTDELRDVVWDSYGSTIRKGVRAIPYLVFNAPSLGMVGGPFRPRGEREPVTINGSMNPLVFLGVFERIRDASLQLPDARDPPAAPAAPQGGTCGGGGGLVEPASGDT